MVLPANKPVRIYGEGKGTAAVKFAGQEKTVFSDTDTWTIPLEPMTYGGPYTMEVSLNGETVLLHDIYVGEVILFSGQSNMQFQMQESNTPEERYRANDKLRIYQSNTDGSVSGWSVCKKEDVASISALAYLVSDEITERKNIAVGAIICCQGASVIESWVPEKAFESLGISIPIEDNIRDHDPSYHAWNIDGTLYHTALSNAIPYPLSAVVWYQGESDASDAKGPVYLEELCTLIDIWRKDFCDEDLFFAVVQIADFDAEMAKDWGFKGWKLVQKAQAEVVKKRPFVKTVISADICETDNIHPPTKDKLAKRIVEALENI